MYTQEEMLAHARALGFTIPEATFRDWIKVGLLGKAKERDCKDVDEDRSVGRCRSGRKMFQAAKGAGSSPRW